MSFRVRPSAGVSRRWGSFLVQALFGGPPSLLMAVASASSVLLLALRSIDSLYLAALELHAVAGVLCLLFLILAFLARALPVMGLRVLLWRLPILLVILINPVTVPTPLIYLTWTPGLLWLDWVCCRWALRRVGCSTPYVDQEFWRFLDYAVVVAATVSGLRALNFTQKLSVPFIEYHWVALPVLVLWFTMRRYRATAGIQRRRRVVAGAVVVLAVTGVLYHRKHMEQPRGDDLHAPGLHRPVARMSDLPSLVPSQRDFLNGSAGCAAQKCHTAIVDQWRGSSHRFSVENRFYQKSVKLFMETQGVEHVRLCINCHDPSLALSPDAEKRYAAGDIHSSEGVSCKGCHAIKAANTTQGDGLYTIQEPTRYLNDTAPIGTPEREDFLEAVRLGPRPHVRDLLVPGAPDRSRLCASCHLVTVPKALGGREFQLHTLFAQWEKSAWKDHFDCVDCHFPRFQIDNESYAFFDHRVMGINADLDLSANVAAVDAGMVRRTSDYVLRYIAGDLKRGSYPAREVDYTGSYYGGLKVALPEVNALGIHSPPEYIKYFAMLYYLSGGPIIDLAVQVDQRLSSDGRLQLSARTTNVRVGHDFPSGPIDVQEVWLEALLADAQGRIVAHVGSQDAQHEVDPLAPRLGAKGIEDADGKALLRHEFWKTAKVVDKRVLKAFAAVEDHLSLPLGAQPSGTYTLTVRWNFRRMNQRIANWLWEDRSVTMPVIVLDSSVIQLTIRPDGAGRPTVRSERPRRPERRSFDDLSKMWIKGLFL